MVFHPQPWATPVAAHQVWVMVSTHPTKSMNINQKHSKKANFDRCPRDQQGQRSSKEAKNSVFGGFIFSAACLSQYLGVVENKVPVPLNPVADQHVPIEIDMFYC